MEMLEDVDAEYRLRFSGIDAYRDAVWKILVADVFQRYVDPEGTVLDLGSGWGEFIRNVRARRRIAMDLNPDMPRRVGPGVEPLLQDCSRRWPLEDDSLDTVFTSNFFEHLPDKDALRRTVLEAWRCLKPGGRIVCLGPNIRLVPGAYWDFWDHFLPLTDESLGELLRLSGFGIDRSLKRFLPYTMARGFSPPPFFVRLYLRFPPAWWILGKQFLVVARKLPRNAAGSARAE
ncbi:MAG: class I SAM-dependent methyltransferase [Planctomycetia bacterium]|jgi:SAM-dependent methyltransferase